MISQQRLRQGVEQAAVADPLLEGPEVLQELTVGLLVEDAGDKRLGGVVVVRVRVDPAAVDLGLVQRLDHVSLDAFDEVRECSSVLYGSSGQAPSSV